MTQHGAFPPPAGPTQALEQLRELQQLRLYGRTKHGWSSCAAAAVWSAMWPGVGHMVIQVPKRFLWVFVALINIAATGVVVYTARSVRNRADLLRVVADRQQFLLLGIGLAMMAAARLYTIIDAAWQARPLQGEGAKAAAFFTTAVLLAVGVVPLTVAADYVRRTDQTLGRVFGNDQAITAGEAFQGFGRVNILLLGGDAGPGRFSMRTDTMVVVSINPDTGDAAMISVPRNLPTLPFPDGTKMHELFPYGFDKIANAVYPYVDARRELGGGTDDAAAQVLKQAMSELMGIPINYYVLVDMAGFVHVVDAIGGIDIYVAKDQPTPGNPGDALHPVPAVITAGQQHMDGTLALAYARTRTADSDFGRMARQRCVLGAIAAAASPMTLALGLPDLLNAFGDSVKTDIPRDKLGAFASLVDVFDKAGGMTAVRTLHLAPPVVDQTAWRLQQIRDLVANVINPGSVPFIHGDLNNQGAQLPPPVAPVLAEECHPV